MNIIKFQDVILDSQSAPSLTDEQISMFNDKLRGKYAYSLNWKYVVPFEDISMSDFIQVSQALTTPTDQYLDLSLLPIEVIDATTNERINDVSRYESYNEFIPDTDINIDDLKKFRQWLANQLLTMDTNVQSYDEKTNQMLTYYKENMFDDTINHLTNFRVIDNKVIYTQSSTCNCTPIIGTQLSTNSVCDPVAIYRQGIYEFMVQTFSQIGFWTVLDKEFLIEFKAYIDGIIGYNLPLYTSEYVSEFADCSCVNVATTAQELLQHILKNLSTSLQYMIDDKIDGHKNFVADSLREWSSKLYEKMQWV